MQSVDEQPETIHLYVVREKEPKPSVFPIVLSALSLIVLLVFCVLVPYQQPVMRAVIRVPAVLLPLKVFSAQAAIIPTGVKVYPATTAHGVLTITNGSVIAQVIPADFTVQNVVTDRAVYVPAGSANGYGYATVSAHTLISGHGGNLLPYFINSVIGSSVYICNLSAFSGGHDSYSVKYVTAENKQTALIKARNELAILAVGLRYPCLENHFRGVVKMVLTWRCQFLTYHIPSYMHVSNVQLIGTNFLLSVWYIEHPKHFWVK